MPSVKDILNEHIRDIVDLARFAPSVHNSQPWKVHSTGEGVIIDIDPLYTLNDGDPTGRETHISLGIFSEALCMAALEYGLHSKINNSGSLRVKINFTVSKNVNATMFRDLIHSRSSDRSVYKPIELPAKTLDAIKNSAGKAAAHVWVVTDTQLIKQTASLTAKGITIALSSPNFRKELSAYLVNPWSSKKRGISTKSLYISRPLAVLEPWLIRYGVGKHSEIALEHKRWLSSSAIVFITTDGDMPHHWFEAGRAYLHVSLAIEAQKLSQATSAAVVEALDYHEDIEKSLGTKQRLQCQLRIGLGAKKRYKSPRVSVSQLLTSNQ